MITQEDKKLLLKDLCARLPYGVVCVGITYGLDDDGEKYIASKVKNTLTEIHNYKLETASVRLGLISSCELETVKPYLRPMSSMTDEEIKYKLSNFFKVINTNIEGVGYKPTLNSFSAIKYIDWLNKNHFDYHGLIEKGLALEAPEGMYK